MTGNGRYIDIVAKELELACICIDYLNLPVFGCVPTAERVLNGDYGFMDYAVLNWTRHLEAGILHLDGHEDKIGELSGSLETFIRIHWKKPTARLPISGRTKKRLKCFEALDSYDRLEQSVVSWKKQLRLEGVKPEEVALDLGDCVLSVRKILEDIATSSSDPSIHKTIKDKYGNTIFKCPQLTCQFFTVGFSSQRERDQHLDKHTQTFRCADKAYRSSIFGFVSEEQRNKHIRDIHPELASHYADSTTDEDVGQSMWNDIVTEEITMAPEEAPPPPQPETEPRSELDSDLDSDLELESDSELEAQHQQEKGYWSTYANALYDNHSVDDTIDETINNTIGNTIDDAFDDTNTEYSTTSSTHFPKADTYIETFARHLANHTSGLSADKTTQTRISNILPSLLKAFALQVGHQTHLPLNRNAMTFVYRYRR